MVAAKTSDDLLSDVRVAAQLADNEGRITSAEMLRMASRLLSTRIAKLLITARQERWVRTHSDVPIVSGTAKYRVPSRALAAGVSDVVIVDAGGEEYDPPYITARDRHYFSGGRRPNSRSPYAYTWEGDHIVILPTPQESQYSLRVRYPRQPPRLVLVASCGLVTNKSATTIDVLAMPSGWGSFNTVDVVEGTPHGDALMLDQLAGISSNTLTIAAGVDSEIDDGDYVCLAGESCVIPLPENVWPVLVEALAVDVMTRLEDNSSTIATHVDLRDEAASAVLAVLEPRSRAERPMLRRRGSPYRSRGA